MTKQADLTAYLFEGYPHLLSGKLTRNLWRRVILRQDCCGHDGEPGC